MTNSNDRQDFYGQRVGDEEPQESSGEPAGEAPAASTPAAEPAPGALDPDGHTQIVDRDDIRRKLAAARRLQGAAQGEAMPAQSPAGFDSAERGAGAAPLPGRTPAEQPRPQYPDGPGPDGLYGGPPPAVSRTPEPSGPPSYGGWPPPGAPGRHGSHRIEDNAYASVGPMRAQIHESQVAAPYKPVPETGWRHGLYKVTRINLGLSASETHWNDLRRRLKVNLRGTYVIAVMQRKGGVNKTTTAALIGAALAQYRDEKIAAIDADPAAGNLNRRIDEPSTMSWRGLNNDQSLRSYSDFREYLGKDSKSGLEVLGSDAGPKPMTGLDLRKSWAILQRFYPIAIVDCGSQLNNDITRALLEDIPVDAIVVPSTTRLDGAKGAEDTLNWLLDSGYPHLVREAVVVVSNINKINANAQVKQLHADFERAVRSVHDVGFDPHLSDAVAIEYTRLQPETWLRYIEAAASLADGFARANDRSPRPAGGAPHDPPTQRQPWGRLGGHEGGQWPESSLNAGPWDQRQ